MKRLTAVAALFVGAAQATSIGGGNVGLQPSNNLSDVGSASASLANLGGVGSASPTFTGTVTIPTLSLTNALSVGNGGTGANTAAAALTNLGAAGLASPTFTGTVTIPTLSLTTALSVANGGTGATSASAARTNLGLGTAATANTTAFLQPSNNLSDVSSVTTARSNLGLGPTGTSCYILKKANGTVAAPLATLTGVTAGGFTLSGGNPSIASGSLSAGSKVHADLFMTKTTTAAVSINIRLGTNGSSSDNIILSMTPGATSVNAYPYGDAYVESATAFLAQGFMAVGNTNTGAGIADKSTAFNTASTNLVSFDVSGGNASDTYNIIAYTVSICP